MPIWSEILSEIGQSTPPDFDGVRRKYLLDLYFKTNRPVILYASAWLQKPDGKPNLLSINDEDLQAFMEVTHGIGGNALDLILHSPGGSPEATEAIVSYLRSRFSEIRVIVPNLAMSAATLLTCAANSVVMGKHSSLGPTDPQLIINTPTGIRAVAAQAVLDQFDLARSECQDPQKIAVWAPMLPQYGPDLVVSCKAAVEMTEELAKTWLETFMFAGDTDAKDKALELASWLTNHQHFKSHGRHISRTEMEQKGFIIQNLEVDQELQDLVLSIFHSTTITFSGTSATKIVENHLGRAFIK